MNVGEFSRTPIGWFLVENNPSGCTQMLNVARKVSELFARRGFRRSKNVVRSVSASASISAIGYGTRRTWTRACGPHSYTFQGHEPAPGNCVATCRDTLQRFNLKVFALIFAIFENFQSSIIDLSSFIVYIFFIHTFLLLRFIPFTCLLIFKFVSKLDNFNDCLQV